MTRLLALMVVLLLVNVGVAEGGTWVVIQPDVYIGTSPTPNHFWRLWHAIWHRNTWVVIAAYDNAKSCQAHASQETRKGSQSQEEFRTHLSFKDWTDDQVFTMRLSAQQTRCMPGELAEKVGTLRVSNFVR
jgi:hypothetical protein